MRKNGYIYFLLNSSMPGLLKIGFTTGTIHDRMAQLNTSGVPTPFELGAAFAVSDAQRCESELHKIFEHKRVNKDREFFEILLEEALTIAFPCVKNYLIDKASGLNEDSVITIDKDDIYFLQFILHDGQAEGKAISTKELKEHHRGYHLLELENKLIHLADLGLIEKVKFRNELISYWKMTQKGIQYMFQHHLVLQDLINDGKGKE